MDARTQAVSAREAKPSRPQARTSSGKAPASSRPSVAVTKAAKLAASARRTWIVLGALAVGLASTGALLKVLAPPPLTPETGTNLAAVGPESSIARIFQTAIAVRTGRWHSIYVHQSLTPSGDAISLARDTEGSGLADHFIIGNGDPLPNGAIQPGPRWSEQAQAGEVSGVEISTDCISICMVGNFNDSRPTPQQQSRLIELIAALQQELTIPSDHVVFGIDSAKKTVAGVGAHFPSAALRSQLVR